jgi:hypothetical protein
LSRRSLLLHSSRYCEFPFLLSLSGCLFLRCLFSCISEYSKRRNDVDKNWEILKHNVVQGAGETLAARKVNTGKTTTKRKPRFCEEIKYLAKEKRKAYLKYRKNETDGE